MEIEGGENFGGRIGTMLHALSNEYKVNNESWIDVHSVSQYKNCG